MANQVDHSDEWNEIKRDATPRLQMPAPSISIDVLTEKYLKHGETPAEPCTQDGRRRCDWSPPRQILACTSVDS
jgi:hypothetical protein